MKTKKYTITYLLTFADGATLTMCDNNRELCHLGGDLAALQEFSRHKIQVSHVTITPA